MKVNLKINKMMIKMNKQRYFDVSFRYSRASWGVLGCLGVSWGNKTDPLWTGTGIILFASPEFQIDRGLENKGPRSQKGPDVFGLLYSSKYAMIYFGFV